MSHSVQTCNSSLLVNGGSRCAISRKPRNVGLSNSSCPRMIGANNIAPQRANKSAWPFESTLNTGTRIPNKHSSVETPTKTDGRMFHLPGNKTSGWLSPSGTSQTRVQHLDRRPGLAQLNKNDGNTCGRDSAQKPAFPAMRLSKFTIWSSPVIHVDTENRSRQERDQDHTQINAEQNQKFKITRKDDDMALPVLHHKAANCQVTTTRFVRSKSRDFETVNWPQGPLSRLPGDY